MLSVQNVSEEEEVAMTTIEYIGTHENTLEHCGLPLTKVLK
jgi:hypothetical protein